MGHSTSTQPVPNTLPSQNCMKICIGSNSGLKITIFLYFFKSVKWVKSYDRVKFSVEATTHIVLKVITQKLYHLEASSWARFVSIERSINTCINFEHLYSHSSAQRMVKFLTLTQVNLTSG